MIVTAPLADGYREAVFWTDDAPPTERPVAALPADADVVVVGGGYCGLSAATEVAEQGRAAVVLDAEAFGWGASSRNGGMVIPELKVGPAGLEQRYGALGRELWREMPSTSGYPTPSTWSSRSSATVASRAITSARVSSTWPTTPGSSTTSATRPTR